VVVAVAVVGVVQVTVDEVVDVVAVRDRRVSATRTMYVSGVVPGAAVLRRACIGIGRRYADRVLVHVVAVGMMQMPVVDVVDVTIVPHSDVAAVRSVHVLVIRVRLAVHCTLHGKVQPQP
jgi:hypothetical protein